MIVVDRIEDSRAVLEILGELVEIPAAALPEGTREGDVLVLARGSARQVREEAQARLARLKRRDTGPDDIEL